MMEKQFEGEPLAGRRRFFADTRNTQELTYTYPVEKLKTGHCYGNSFVYASLDGNTNLASEQGSVRFGLRESTNQRYYLAGWEVSVTNAEESFQPRETTFAPAYQETLLQAGGERVRKRFFVPFENHHLRSAHFCLTNDGEKPVLGVISCLRFPAGTRVSTAEYQGQHYLAAHFDDGTTAAAWASGSLMGYQVSELPGQAVEVSANYTWSGAEFALSYAYTPGKQVWLGAFFDVHTARPPFADAYHWRIHLMWEQTHSAFQRYLQTCQSFTPDRVINQALAWAKVNQLRDQQEYKWGAGFSNNPPCDVVVGRDSVWYLSGSSYFAQAWSRRLLDLWLRHGLEPEGKFTEFMNASADPLFKDDYGLNVNDNTPLFLIVMHQYYSLTGDRDFLNQAYPTLLRAADYLLSQRRVGDANPFGLVWCTSREEFVRGLCGWRNCIRGYALSGAVTEVNVECYHALRMTAELAAACADDPNRERLQAAAADLRLAIDRHLRCATPQNPYYLLNITPDGEKQADMTGDLLFPVLYGVADQTTAEGILLELFSERFWASVGEPYAGGGMRTVSINEANYTPKADPDSYGLLGGVWPNLALWTARAAAAWGFPDLALKALRETFLLSERDDPAAYNVLPGQLPEYFNGDDLVQRGQPRSTFLFGIYTWAGTESFLGLSPHPDRLEVRPSLPADWKWAAVARLPYRGFPLSMLAAAQEKTLYTTLPVSSDWRQVICSAAEQERYEMEAEGQLFWLVAPHAAGLELIAASDTGASGRFRDRQTRAVLFDIEISAGSLVKKAFPANHSSSIYSPQEEAC